MAYIINLKHDVPGETFDVTLHYNDSSSSNADITITGLTSTLTDYELTGWTDVDASKITIGNDYNVERGSIKYIFKNSNVHITNQQ